MAEVGDSTKTPTLAEADQANQETLKATPWVEYAVQQAELAHKYVEDTIDSLVGSSKCRVSEIRSNSSPHVQKTIDSLQEVKTEFHAYEDIFFGKVKEGILFAASHPMVASGVAFGVGIMGFKRPRRFLYYNMRWLFLTEESLLSGAVARVKEMRQSVDVLKTEIEKMEQVTLGAEEEMKRGRTKLRQAGSQIESVIRSAYKVERQATGLKDILGELPRVEAYRFRSQVSKLSSEAQQERKALTKEVSKISNHGISV